MKELETLHKIKVRPFNNPMLERLIGEAIGVYDGSTVKIMEQNSFFFVEAVPFTVENQDYSKGLTTQQLMDTMPLVFVETKITHCYMIPCQIVMRGEQAIPNNVTFYYPFGQKYFDAYADQEISLRDYLGQESFDRLETEMLFELNPGLNKSSKTVN